MTQEEEIQQRYLRIAGDLTERTRRLFAANEALSLGWGGISAVSRATGLSRQVISDGIQELQGGKRAEEGRVRRKGGGRKSNVSKDPKLCEDLERLVEPVTRGDPQSPLRWTSKSVRKLSKQLQGMGHQVSHELVSELLHELGYSLQANRKTQEGGTQPDRDAQFEHLNAQAAAFLAAGEPAVSVDAKKKELVGDFKNPGREWHPQGAAEQVRVYDFPIKGLGRATPYGVYDLGRNAGWVNVGIDHDTAAFAVETGLAITVCHLPPGTSKWNKIEHRLFAWISQNWRGKPLVSYAVILQLIAATTTEAGLTVQCQLDTKSYPAGRKVSEEEMATLSIQPDSFHGEWNYTILPRTASVDNIIPRPLLDALPLHAAREIGAGRR